MLHHLLIRTTAILIASYLTKVGVPLVFDTSNQAFQTFGTAFFVYFGLALLNHTIKPILVLVSIPINAATFGLFSVVINTLMVIIVSHMVSGFVLPSIPMAMFFAVVLATVNWLLHVLD
jgi:putative membrane protein